MIKKSEAALIAISSILPIFVSAALIYEYVKFGLIENLYLSIFILSFSIVTIFQVIRSLLSYTRQA